MRTLGILLTLMIVACAPKAQGTSSNTTTASKQPKGLPPAPPTPPAQGPTCESAIANSMTLSLAAAGPDDKAALQAQLDAAKSKMITACHEDAWSPALLDCLDKARTDAATGKCSDLLTPAQQEAVAKRLSGP